MAATTWRSTIIPALQTLVNTYQAANPTLLAVVERKRPKAIGDSPMVYFGGRTERIVSQGNIMQRVISLPVVILDTLGDNTENADRVDVLVDGLITLFKQNPHTVTNTLISVVGVQDVEDDFGPVTYAGSAITLTCELQEGI